MARRAEHEFRHVFSASPDIPLARVRGGRARGSEQGISTRQALSLLLPLEPVAMALVSQSRALASRLVLKLTMRARARELVEV